MKWRHADQPSPLRHRTDRRRAVVGYDRAAVQGGAGVATAGVAHVRPLQRGCGCAAGGGRHRLRTAWSPAVLAWGAVGYGGTVLVQNAGITKTSVSHAALLIGATPVLVALVAAVWRHAVARPVAWAGFVLSLAGVGLVAGGPGGGATAAGDGLVLASLLLSATFTVAQTGLLRGRDPIAVTAVQFLAAAAAMLPIAVVREGMPPFPSSAGTLLAVAALALGGTVLPFALFAYGQVRVSAEVAGAFLNLEPLVGAVAGAVVFQNPVGAEQVLGGTAILAGIGLSSLPLLAVGRGPRPVRATEPVRAVRGRCAPVGGAGARCGAGAPCGAGARCACCGGRARLPASGGPPAGPPPVRPLPERRSLADRLAGHPGPSGGSCRMALDSTTARAPPARSWTGWLRPSAWPASWRTNGPSPARPPLASPGPGRRAADHGAGPASDCPPGHARVGRTAAGRDGRHAYVRGPAR